MSGRLQIHMLSIDNEYNLRFWNFLIIGLLNFPVNFWLSGVLVTALVPRLSDFLLKVCKWLKQVLFDFHHIVDCKKFQLHYHVTRYLNLSF